MGTILAIEKQWMFMTTTYALIIDKHHTMLLAIFECLIMVICSLLTIVAIEI